MYNIAVGLCLVASVRPRLSAEVCASARNLPLECFQNFGQSSQLSPFVSFAMLEA